MSVDEARTYADWFACIGDPTRVRMLHEIASAPSGSASVGALAESLGISQSTASHHVRRLADVGFVDIDKRGTTTVVSVNTACCTGLPHAADVVMGSIRQLPCCPDEVPGVRVRALAERDWPDVRRIYAEGIETGQATFETEVPSTESLQRNWLDGHRWVAEVDGQVAGWAAVAPVSRRKCYAGVGESSVYVGDGWRGRGVGKALVRRQVMEADAGGLWTLQTSVFPENRPSVALHHSAGFRTLGVRERIAELNGVWRDTVLMERRAA
ncbi:MAG: metalloregulator ArsR/SmtB family transcription factor [Actinomycetia bacterium]|nr:metalloregulator ArsR/SmtB family transcription factor [Actinomycetes bacterium]